MEFPPALQQVITEAWSLPHQIQHVSLRHSRQGFIVPPLRELASVYGLTGRRRSDFRVMRAKIVALLAEDP